MRTGPQYTASQGNAPRWHALSAGEAENQLGVSSTNGLTFQEAAARLLHNGPNILEKHEEEPWWKEALESLTEPLQLLLIAVAAVYFWLGETEDALTILAVILAVAAIEVFSELRAKRAIAALSRLSAPNATVIRDGKATEIPTREVVSGDLVLLAAGDRVPADVRLVESVALRVDESSITGESVPVLKQADLEIAQEADLGDRINMAFAGTLIAAGKGSGLVVAIGAETEIGRIAGLVETAREPQTPLQVGLNQLSKWLLWVAIGFSLLVPLLGVWIAGQPVKDMILVGLTLAFATIPEELPILITIVLGLGAYQLSQRHAIVRRLRAAETLGSVSVVATDKTGTLTENQMHLVEVLVNGEVLDTAEAALSACGRRMLLVGVIANDAQVAGEGNTLEFIGDPTETALLRAAQKSGLDVTETRQSLSVIEEYPFTSERVRMSVLFTEYGGVTLAVKGSPESILAVCTSICIGDGAKKMDGTMRESAQKDSDTMADRGLRVLAIAERAGLSAESANLTVSEVEQDLVFLGLAGLQDPPRPEVRGAIEALKSAGIRVLMVTGDHPATAKAIANQVGIDSSSVARGADLDQADNTRLSELVKRISVFARITPEHKLRVVRALQDSGEVVAVTGDGVNDAPALREAAIGVAMGRNGTDAAREAADLILADDNFATITEALRTGRVLYANLHKAVRYYLAAKVALVTASLAAVLLKLPVPFEPVQIIVMELFMDLGASVTFVSEPAERDVMKQPPRKPDHPFMDAVMLQGIVFGGLSLGLVVLVSYLGVQHWGGDVVQAKTAAFAAWMVGHVVLAAHMRFEREPLLGRSFFSNRAFVVWAVAAIALVVISTSLPMLRERLHLSSLTADMWYLVLGAALILPSWWEPWKWWRARQSEKHSSS
ncbi:MAG: cation-transporting P-type ATPase [Thiobacillus sp.]|uniref:cation-translocating P-type ATPase n=1 Tax=Thiobacillus sp. TaxID=924 RepID=UPI002894CB3E|nr:cation-transporting P-type ATPase [Thiobacillus sp.]MDT3708463.1 cation-transporting P-type ATPase [Thiobacillus sp.]